MGDFHQDVVVVKKWFELEFGDQFFRDHAAMDAHVFRVWHGCAEVEIFEITGDELGAWGGENAVDQDLDSGEIRSFRASVAGVVDEITTHGPTDAARVFFFRAISAYYTKVCGFLVGRLPGTWDEFDGAGFDEAPDFFNVGGAPQMAFAAGAESRVLGDEASVRVESIAVEG